MGGSCRNRIAKQFGIHDTVESWHGCDHQDGVNNGGMIRCNDAPLPGGNLLKAVKGELDNAPVLQQVEINLEAADQPLPFACRIKRGAKKITEKSPPTVSYTH